jgi:1,6-anhydro-N-acetylmuramate kinase
MVKVIGLNSGSSFDDIDVVLVEIENGPDGYPARPTFISGKFSPHDWRNSDLKSSAQPSPNRRENSQCLCLSAGG